VLAEQEKLVPYVVCYGLKHRREIWTAEKIPARDALALVQALQSKGEEIRFIKAPAEGEVSIYMLRVIVDEEGLPKA
jgi:hypothetical protein